MTGLAAKSLNSVFWGGGGSLLRILLQLVTQIALARILGPDQYGLFAIGAIVISFSNFFSDIGIAYGLIQKDEVTEDDLRFVFTWQLIIGILVTLAVGIASSGIASFFGDIAAKDVVFTLAVVCLINALAAPSMNMLKRNMNFKQIQISQLAGYVGGYLIVGLPMALAGAQVWALVTAWIVQATIVLTLQYSASKHSLRPLIWYPGARRVSDYGAIVLITNVTNWMIGNIDRVIVGRLFASKEIGIYATTYNLLQNPTSAMLQVLQPVFFSASARISDDHQKMSGGYLALLGATSIAILPVFLTVSAIAETFVLALYGKAWFDAAQILRPLAIAMPLFLIWGLTTPLLWSTGNPSREFKVQLPIAVLWAGVSWLAANHSFAMVGWAVPLMFTLRCYLIMRVANSILNISWLSLWRATRGGLFVALVCASSAATADHWLTDLATLSAIERLLIEVILCAAVYLLLLSCVPKLLAADLVKLIEQLAMRCPKTISRALRALPDLRANHVK